MDIRIAADSTMFRIVNLLIALSLGVHREQLEHLMGLTWPRPFLLRPLRRRTSVSNPYSYTPVYICVSRKRSVGVVLVRALLDHAGRV